LTKEKAKLQQKVEELKALPEKDAKAIAAAEKAVADFPADVAVAAAAWKKDAAGATARAAPIRPHATAFPGKDEAARNTARLNFLALIFCLMVGTAALPHILMRYYTTPSVREARKSVFWSLFFITLLYFTAPALAVLVKFDVYTLLVGSKFADLPAWVSSWAAVDKTLMSISDLNKDGIVQLAEIVIGGDLIVLATPEIAGLPYVVSGLVAAGGLAAALSTADGLLLTISNALSHDVYYKMIDPKAAPGTRVKVAKGLLLVVAGIAAYVTSFKPGDILFLVGAAFSLAASAFFPALVCGIFWRRANKTGAVLGMLAGLFMCIYYMVITYPFFGGVAANQWFGIAPISAGIFGIPVGFLGIIAGTLLSAPPPKEVQELVDHVRYPSLAGDIDTKAT
ncbi:MAG: VC_2705 family sodium/solute symporter, partial [Smithellaceae bacterium]|nr:VC_2705 family sodium/solute symporter [Smithellaceae bacterium]